MSERFLMNPREADDGLYDEKKCEVAQAFARQSEGWSIYSCVGYLFDGWTDDELNSTSGMLFVIAIAEYEIRHDILEDRVRNAASYHIYRYENMGRYKDELLPEEIVELEKDIAFIKSKVELPEIVSYEDRD